MASKLDRAGRSPLHYAARDGDGVLCRTLLITGADPNLADSGGWTPLHFAAQASSAEATAALLAFGADVGARDAFGNTALFRAVFSSRGRGDVIQLLRQAGADPASENVKGISPISLARGIGNQDVAQFFADLP